LIEDLEILFNKFEQFWDIKTNGKELVIGTSKHKAMHIWVVSYFPQILSQLIDELQI